MAAIYVYAPKGASGAIHLAQALKAERLRRFDGMDFWNKTKRFSPEEGSTIVCCGTSLPELDGVRVLNSMEVPLDRWQEYNKLTNARIPTIRITKGDTINSVEMYIQAGYLPRLNQHTGGTDLLYPTLVLRPDFYVMKETFTNEYRIHSFGGRSIRAGIKVPLGGYAISSANYWRPNANFYHPFVKTPEGGWKVNYDFASTPAMRELAHKAVKCLGLTFAAVDIVQRTDGNFAVVGVNTILEDDEGTLSAYSRAIQRWIKRESIEEVEGNV